MVTQIGVLKTVVSKSKVEFNYSIIQLFNYSNIHISYAYHPHEVLTVTLHTHTHI
jgi:hypothetical protein